MVNRGKEIDIDIRNFEPNVTSTSWAKKMTINFSFLSNRCAFHSFCHWFSMKFAKNGISCVVLFIFDFLALNRRHKPFLALLGDCSSYSYFLNRGSKLTYQASLGKPTVVARRSFVNLYRISMQDGAFSLGYNNG